jgi:hypothetical protein
MITAITVPRSAPHLMRRGVVLLLCLALGLHWMLLQGAAWTGMLISFARQGSVIESVQKTFDGRHACVWCQKLKNGRNASQKPPAQTVQQVKKMDAVLIQTSVLVAPAGDEIRHAPVCGMLLIRHEKPEPPPPRRGSV